MITNEWNTHARYRGTELPMSYTRLAADYSFTVQQTGKIPLITCFNRKEVLEFDAERRQFLRMVDAATVLDIFIRGSEIVYIKIRGRFYFVGKGILFDKDKKLLAMIAVSNTFYQHFARESSFSEQEIARHCTLYVRTGLRTDPEHKQIFGLLHQAMSGCSFDVVYTTNMKQDAFASITPPHFATLTAREHYINRLKGALIEDLLTAPVC